MGGFVDSIGSQLGLRPETIYLCHLALLPTMTSGTDNPHERKPEVQLKSFDDVSRQFEDYSEPSFASRFFVQELDQTK